MTTFSVANSSQITSITLSGISSGKAYDVLVKIGNPNYSVLTSVDVNQTSVTEVVSNVGLKRIKDIIEQLRQEDYPYIFSGIL